MHGGPVVGAGLEGHLVHQLAHEVEPAPVGVEEIRGIRWVLYPGGVEALAVVVDPDRDLPRTDAEDEGDRLVGGEDVPVLDLLSQFRSHTAEEMYLVTYVASGPPATGCFPDARRYSGPAYPSRFGNQVSSEAIVAWLRTTGTLDSGHRR